MKNNVVVKIGGSLMDEPAILKESIATLLDSTEEIAIVNGSGSLRHQHKAWLRRARVDIDPVKDLALLHQQRLMGSHLLSLLDSRLVIAASESSIYKAWEGRKTPIVVATDIIPETNKRMGADTAAAHLCKALGHTTLLKMTDVDGVFDQNGTLVPRLDYPTLAAMGQTCVDDGTAPVLQNHDIDCFVVNGYNAANLSDFLQDQPYTGTVITKGEYHENI